MRFDPVSLEIMWGRLLHITDEMWITVLRTAVSTIIGAANDFGCELLDAEGRSLAHAYRSMPVFNMTLPNVVKHLLKKFPIESMKPGDVFFTNDPWLCAGHLPDLAVVNPVFYRDRVVGFVGSIANTSDIGDRWMLNGYVMCTKKASLSPSVISTKKANRIRSSLRLSKATSGEPKWSWQISKPR